MKTNRVKEYREKAGLTQTELATKANVARTIVSQLENGTREVITTETMSKLSTALGVTAEEIFLL